MKQLMIALIALLGLLIPASVIAQPGPEYIQRCYTVLVPFPHTNCEWVRVRYDYRPAPPPPPRRGHMPPPPPRGPRPGHHPPPPPHHGHGHHR